VARYQSWEAPYSIHQARQFFEELRLAQPGSPGVWYQLAVEKRDPPGIIGDCAFQVFEDDARQAHIGYTFSRQNQRQGYATEAVKRLLDYLFDDLHLHRVSAICDMENLPSARLMERVGMRREGAYIENIWFKGAWGSEYFYAILGSERGKKLSQNL
jgi:aminoglycoside 6'-N-acetyltransferase